MYKAVSYTHLTFISWASLDYQTYFNSTASNVLYGYWSHDIGGHQGVDHIDPELYVRWMQFGAFSPILRSHSTKIAGLTKAVSYTHLDVYKRQDRQRAYRYNDHTVRTWIFQ